MIYLNKGFFLCCALNFFVAANMQAGTCGSKPAKKEKVVPKENAEGMSIKELETLLEILKQDPVVPEFSKSSRKALQAAQKELQALIAERKLAAQRIAELIAENAQSNSGRAHREWNRLEEIARKISEVELCFDP